MRSVSGSTCGFAAVDALVALTILAAMIALGADALISSRRVAFAAAEVQRADVLLPYLLAREKRLGSDEAGSLSGFNWRIRTTYLPADANAAGLTLCRRWAGATATRSGRRYVLASLDFCAKPKAAS